MRWYYRFNLSLRDIEELLLERGVTVTYESVRRWCDRFGAQFARRAKAARRKPGSIWHLDEVLVNLRGEPYVLWRAVDEHGTELDVLLQKRRDKAAAKRFFIRVLRSAPVPRKIITDQLRSYPAAKARHMRGFRDPRRTQAFRSCFGPIRQHFALPRHRMAASCHRAQLKAQFTVWRRWTAAEAAGNTH